MTDAPDRLADHNGDARLAAAKQEMLRLVSGYVRDHRVVDAMATVPREHFVPEWLHARAYDDAALPIGEGQTISQPLIVAMMLDALHLRARDRVLDIGTGSGYQAALLGKLVAEVITVERVPLLIERARAALASLGCDNVHVFAAIDVLGWPDRAPYDAIVVAAGAPHVPRELIDQLGEGGRLVMPIGTLFSQELTRVTKTSHGVDLARLGPCAFVPLIGKNAWPERGPAALR
jgi:protein-L-isoaspartate(D-aspartate) O-methyltransferase